MAMLDTLAEVTCPHCWETIALYLDLSVQEQSYVEDCLVCCRPMNVHYDCDDDGKLHVNVEACS